MAHPIDYLWHLWYSIDWDYVWNGISLALGVGLIWLLGAVAFGLSRAISGSTGFGVKFLFQLLVGWVFYERGENPNVVNVTLNSVHKGTLKFDTILADRPLYTVWQNVFLVQMIKRAAKRTTFEDPLIRFRTQKPASRIVRLLQRAKIMENGEKTVIRLQREDDYTAMYGAVIGIVSEKMNNNNALSMSLGHTVLEHRYVLAVTFEKLSNRRSRHFRVMVMRESELISLPDKYPNVWREEHKTRYATLLNLRDQYKAHPNHFGILYVWDRVK